MLIFKGHFFPSSFRDKECIEDPMFKAVHNIVHCKAYVATVC